MSLMAELGVDAPPAQAAPAQPPPPKRTFTEKPKTPVISILLLYDGF